MTRIGYSRTPANTEGLGKLAVFACYLASETGAYTIGEALVFGDTLAKRKPVLEALQKKWADGSTWELSKLKAMPKKEQYH